MRRTAPILALAALAVALAIPASAAARYRSSYCSPSGDYCHAARYEHGRVFLRFSTLSFSGSVRICVTTPHRKRLCKSFTLRKNSDGVYAVKVRWSRHYPLDGHGIYRVAFFAQGGQLGPRDGFHAH